MKVLLGVNPDRDRETEKFVKDPVPGIECAENANEIAGWSNLLAIEWSEQINPETKNETVSGNGIDPNGIPNAERDQVVERRDPQRDRDQEAGHDQLK